MRASFWYCDVVSSARCAEYCDDGFMMVGTKVQYTCHSFSPRRCCLASFFCVIGRQTARQPVVRGNKNFPPFSVCHDSQVTLNASPTCSLWKLPPPQHYLPVPCHTRESGGAFQDFLDMVSFRRKKKVAKEKGKLEAKQQQSKKEEKSSAPTKQRKKKPKAANSTPRSISKEYNSPLTTITETHDEEHVLVTPAAESSLLQTVNVVSSDSKSVNESTEVVFGSASSKMSLTTEDELTNVSLQHDTDVVKKTDDDTPNKMSSQHDDIRKTLFQEDQVDKRMSAEQVHLVTPPDRANEPPFDVQADYGGDEDPTIMDLIDEDEEKQQEDNQTSSAQNSITEQRKEVTTYIEDDAAVPQNMFRSDIRNASITKKLLAAFNCNMDTTQDIKAPSCKGMGAFYDTMCSDVRGKRPFFSEEFSRDFMEVCANDLYLSFSLYSYMKTNLTIHVCYTFHYYRTQLRMVFR